MLKYLFLGAVAVFVAFHYWPSQVKKAGSKIADTTVAATKAGYNEAKK